MDAERATSIKEIESAQAIAGDTKIKKAACVLSMLTCDLVPGRMATALAGATAESTSCVGEWQADPSSRDESWYTVSAAPSVADTLCNDVRQAGMSCRVLDALPHALARAAMLASPSGNATHAVLDCGHANTTFAVVRGGKPLYVRQFKGEGVSEVESLLSEELGISRTDALRLFASHAAARGSDAGNAESGSQVAALLDELSTPYQETIAEELHRTLTHLRSHRRGLVPQQLCLLGGGSLLDLTERLSNTAELPVQVWTVETDEPQLCVGTQPLFGVAAGLSALAWEAR